MYLHIQNVHIYVHVYVYYDIVKKHSRSCTLTNLRSIRFYDMRIYCICTCTYEDIMYVCTYTYTYTMMYIQKLSRSYFPTDLRLMKYNIRTYIMSTCGYIYITYVYVYTYT